jgi:hypothetical protein
MISFNLNNSIHHTLDLYSALQRQSVFTDLVNRGFTAPFAVMKPNQIILITSFRCEVSPANISNTLISGISGFTRFTVNEITSLSSISITLAEYASLFS